MNSTHSLMRVPCMQITYSLASGIGDAPEFSINSQTGAIITTKALDREIQSGYLLTVTAKDGGLPPLSDTTDVEISVSDINDNAPVFSKQSYSGSISEDALVGTSVLQVMRFSVLYLIEVLQDTLPGSDCSRT